MNLGDRMKMYESTSSTHLLRRVPVIMRLDGKAFHTFTRGFEKPWDMTLVGAMFGTAKFLCENIQGAKVAYTQSDEITILITDYENLDTCAWFDYKVQKMTSVAASMATLRFNNIIRVCMHEDFSRNAYFDCRVFNIPKEDVNNNFVWRQLDATRNSIQGLGQANFSHKELQNKTCNMIQDMLFTQKGINWNDCETWQKRGACIVKKQHDIGNGVMRGKWEIDYEIPIFTQDHDYINKLL